MEYCPSWVILLCFLFFFFFFFNDTATTEIYTLSLHDALPIYDPATNVFAPAWASSAMFPRRSEEHTSELQSHSYLVCRLLLEKKKENSEKRPTPACSYMPGSSTHVRADP